MTRIKNPVKIENNFSFSFLDDKIEHLPRHMIEKLSKEINKFKRIKYPNRKGKLYGNTCRSVTSKDFQKILKFELDPRIQLAFKFMFHMGLRVSEVVLIKKQDISNSILTINNVKCQRREVLPIPSCIIKDVSNHIKFNINQIKLCGGYLFYTNNNNFHRQYLSKDWLRNRFRTLVSLAGFEKIYGVDKAGKKRHTYTTHSLRRGFGRRMYKLSNNNIEHTRILLRHSDTRNLSPYIQDEPERAYSILNKQ